MKPRIMSDLSIDISQYVFEIVDIYVLLMNNWESTLGIYFNKIGGDWGKELWREDGKRNEEAY